MISIAARTSAGRPELQADNKIRNMDMAIFDKAFIVTFLLFKYY